MSNKKIGFLLACTIFLLSNCTNFENRPKTTQDAEEIASAPSSTPLPSDLSSLVSILLGNNDEARIGAARLIPSFGLEASIAVPALTQNLYYQNSDVRSTVAETLGKLGPASRPSIPVLIVTLLSDDAIEPRRNAAIALQEIGDLSSIPALAQCLNDSDEGVKIMCAKAIARIAQEEFPDTNSTGYQYDAKGIPLIVNAAKDWWERKGRYKDWINTTPTNQ
jgi:hypothetical protein